MPRPALVVTSISPPNQVLRELAAGANNAGFDFLVIGDTKSPEDFELPGCDFYSFERQLQTGFRFAELCPTGHYARKNIGYLLAIRAGAWLILETDDDNHPCPEFWSPRGANVVAPFLGDGGWVNVYRYFSDALIWPRGFPLDEIQKEPPPFETLPRQSSFCPIHQGLADENPDVDAIYRLILPLPQSFRKDRRLVLGAGSWCPFNSQNTVFWPEAFPLLYLPAYCSFRMTDIWRSFVAQKIAWVNGWNILFHEPNVRQSRNAHSLMADFEDEVPGYLRNRAMCKALDALELFPGADAMPENLRNSYRMLVNKGWIDRLELSLLDTWLEDLTVCQESWDFD